ncbi:MAG: hypothetical protein ABMA64_19165 [Myxococcota bacterium]
MDSQTFAALLDENCWSPTSEVWNFFSIGTGTRELDRGGAADPGALLVELERLADERPGDRRVARAIRGLADRIAAEAHCPPVVAGVRRERLVRWDADTVTFVGTDAAGDRRMVRTLRAGAAGDPVLRRQLLRDGRALGPVCGAALDEGLQPAIHAGLPGAEASPRRGAALARPLVTALIALSRWEAAGLSVPPLGESELRVDLGTGTCAVVCLTPVLGTSAAGIASVAGRLVDPGDDSGLAAAARGLGGRPPDTIDDAARVIRGLLGEALASRRHALVLAWRSHWHRSRRERLHLAVRGLLEAVPPPAGLGAVGVDLDGAITVVHATAEAVTWGAGAAPEVVFDRTGGVRAQVARRLLRARAVSPPNAALDQRVGGDSESTERICRWVAVALRLRTLQLLLERHA